MQIEIRESKDAEVIARLNETVQNLHVHHYPRYFKPYAYDAVKQSLSERLQQEHWYAFVAFVENTPVGYVLCYQREYQENPFRYAYRGLHVDQMCVLESYQRMQIGSLLMDRVEEFAVAQQLDHIELTFWENNRHAKNFYTTRGFTPHMHFVIKALSE